MNEFDYGFSDRRAVYAISTPPTKTNYITMLNLCMHLAYLIPVIGFKLAKDAAYNMRGVTSFFDYGMPLYFLFCLYHLFVTVFIGIGVLI